MNANQLRACATWFHQLANEAFIVFRTLEAWEAPKRFVDKAHSAATGMRALATRFELEANRLEALSRVEHLLCEVCGDPNCRGAAFAAHATKT